MQSTYPDAMIGYNAEIEKRYRANPVTFHQEVAAARRQPAAAPRSRADRARAGAGEQAAVLIL